MWAAGAGAGGTGCGGVSGRVCGDKGAVLGGAQSSQKRTDEALCAGGWGEERPGPGLPCCRHRCPGYTRDTHTGAAPAPPNKTKRTVGRKQRRSKV